jgi:ligand-binding SRPBCC domain-containing protein
MLDIGLQVLRSIRPCSTNENVRLLSNINRKILRPMAADALKNKDIHLLYHFPHTSCAPLRPQFSQFPWQCDPQGLRTWQRGRNRVPDCGRRHARVVDDRVDAQSGADGRRFVPRERLAVAVDRRRAVVLGHAGGRRPCQQHAWLAVGGLHGVPLHWQSEITAWEPPHRFVDEQRRGPYREWIHVHTFAERDGGSEVRDFVRYAAPGGRLVDRLFVRRDARRIFEYRIRRLRELFA